jgi:ABC-type polysaccharide/polyol phosphate transport system ATPase subunit
MAATIHAEGLGVRFLFDRDQRPLSPNIARLRRRGSEAWGLRDVSVSVGPGEGVALIGSTGAGKTTLLRAIAGVMPSDAGRIEVRGRVGSLLSVDSGLSEALTGRENAALLAVLAGLSRAEARQAMEGIKARSQLGEAFERTASSYSQGMRARLGFAAVDSAGPDILVLDEVHEAIDHRFRKVLENRAQDVLASGGIVVAAGHDHEILDRLCARALWIEDGAIRGDGDFDQIRRAYLNGNGSA